MRAVSFWFLAARSIVVAASVYTEELCLTRFGPVSLQNVPSSISTIDIFLTAFQIIHSTQEKTITPSSVTSTIVDTETSTIVITAPQITNEVITTQTGISIFILQDGLLV